MTPTVVEQGKDAESGSQLSLTLVEEEIAEMRPDQAISAMGEVAAQLRA